MSKEFRHIVRITEKDLLGTEKLAYVMAKINGIGINLTNAILRKADVNTEIRVGALTESDVEKIEDVIRNPDKHGLPPWLFNRQKDLDTGKNVHLIGSDLVLRGKTDIDQMKTIKSWRGYRHAYGLKVRGQRTKTTGRSGKALGVKKKLLLAQRRQEGAKE
jgi:small subunit ribosomal protein S13